MKRVFLTAAVEAAVGFLGLMVGDASAQDAKAI